MDRFTVKQVQRSIRRFRDYAEDLLSSDMNTFNDRLNMFITFCKTDPVFSKIHQQLITGSSVNIEDWYKERKNKMSSMAGSASLDFPADVDERISLQYQLLVAINENKINRDNFFLEFFAIGTIKIDLFIAKFCDSVVAPLCRELDYKLQDIEERLNSEKGDTVPDNILQVISNNGTFIQQIAVGDNNTQTVNQASMSEEIKDLFKQLKEEVRSTVANQKEQKEAFELIARAEEELGKKEPKKSVIKALLDALPKLPEIISVVSAILKCVDTSF